MIFVDFVIALAAIQFIVFGVQVGAARARYGVKAPATTGNDAFERYFRVQQNTLELLICFLPGIYLFSRYVNPLWAAGLGAVYRGGRQLYAMEYVKNPAARGPGYLFSMLPIVVMLLGGAGAAIWQQVR